MQPVAHGTYKRCAALATYSATRSQTLLRRTEMRLRKLIRPFSLRWRLTIGSTLVVGVVFAIFTGVAYLTVRNINELWYKPIYNRIDNDMSAWSSANQMYIFRSKQLILSVNQIGNVYFVLLDKDGKPAPNSQSIPLSDNLFQQVISQPLVGEKPIADTVTLPDGSRARVLLTPIDLLESGEMKRMGVLVAVTPINLLDQLTNEIINEQVKTYLILRSRPSWATCTASVNAACQGIRRVERRRGRPGMRDDPSRMQACRYRSPRVQGAS